ncbi:alpha-D-ribose 1-methylphosphonate 5-triphosphate diphosphatase [Alkalihalobacillus sp. LMS39]|uniref:alpha-D-ribose 1-methylphosphonate 5-triphosphate diphosphatase n=1 Tax=Alkalihalobacillus sp. LMS39 TaxID=2924032 RepID=UPI001FB233E5|nr:alpha-D-ribose 1-methylphosphonate 5-triphosphate diphosphatase [Alkalihalobacillus sp. LMS39]UOE95413.1 alpha-D-ribose 1-methylphosphonate 5-triphosphate diphosphatase [Alkalihalobacillus sp. LMS39]
MTNYRIYGGNIVTPTSIIKNGTVEIEQGRITNISNTPIYSPNSSDVDATGKWIMPGLIDTHSDTIEREIQPRPGSVFPIELSFFELERKLAVQGITTIYHSLSMLGERTDKYLRQNDLVRSLFYKLKELAKQEHLVRHKLHLRFEITNREAVHVVEEFIEQGVIDQLSFMDHTPGQGQWRNIELQKQLMMSQNHYTEEETMEILEEKKNLPKIDPSILQKLASLAAKHHIPLASHDDDSIEKLEAMEGWDVSISEFPIELSIAKEAKARGLHTVMGAPNVILGRSHSENLSALEALKEGVVDVLCSDYYPPSMIQSVFHLWKKHQYDLPFAMNLVSLNPAKALGISQQFGSITEGKVADILVVNEKEETPNIEQVFVGGNLVCGLHYIKQTSSIHV